MGSDRQSHSSVQGFGLEFLGYDFSKYVLWPDLIVFKENKGGRGGKVVSEGQLVGDHCQNQQEGRSSTKTMWVGRGVLVEKNQIAEAGWRLEPVYLQYIRIVND